MKPLDPLVFSFSLTCGVDASVFRGPGSEFFWAVRDRSQTLLAGGTTFSEPSAIACLRWAVDSILERSKAEASKAFEGLAGA